MKCFYMILFTAVVAGCSRIKPAKDCINNQAQYKLIYEVFEKQKRNTLLELDSGDVRVHALSYYDVVLEWWLYNYKWQNGHSSSDTDVFFYPTPKESNLMRAINDKNTLFIKYTTSQSPDTTIYISNSKQTDDNFCYRNIRSERIRNTQLEFCSVTYPNENGCIVQAYYYQYLKSNPVSKEWVLIEAAFKTDEIVSSLRGVAVYLPANASMRTGFRRRHYRLPFSRSLEDIINDARSYDRVI